MTSKREHLFPPTSIGRTQGSRLQRVDSHDSLTAHPLLTSNRPSSPSPDQTVNGPPRYVPYTPRQRVQPTAVTTGTIVQPSSPQPHQGDATSKLHLVNLKAALQNVGLGTGSVGWAILEKLVSYSDNYVADWTDVWTAVASGKATLLLPLEQASFNQVLTPEFVKDHIILYDGATRKHTHIVTLSGLRGILDNETLTFRSSIHPSSKIFQDLLNPATRQAALSVLPDLPLPFSTSQQPSTQYPTFTLPSYTSSLPLPPHVPPSLAVKPPLPPRPANRAVSSPTTSTAQIPTPTSRISNPFASLFGGSSHTSLPKVPTISTPGSAPSPASAPIPGSPTSSPPASLHSVDPSTQTLIQQPESPVIDVSAFTISRKIVRKDVGKDMNKALRRDVQDCLTNAHPSVVLPVWVIDRVHEFTAPWYPVVKDTEPVLGSGPRQKKIDAGTGDKRKESIYVVNRMEETPDDAAARLQEFYLELEQDVRIGGPSAWGAGDKVKLKVEGEEHEEKDDERRVREKIDDEARIKEVMEVVERTICSLFYDRLYMQPTSDDASHDETLSSRVAALNLLDLGLEHLDIHVGEAGPELDAVVRACGKMLTQLDACRSPGDKSAVLVAAHKILVDGLTRLPPIRLMSDEESKAQKTKASAVIAKSKAVAPPRDMDGKLRIMTPMVPHPELEVQSPKSGDVVPLHEQAEGDPETARPASSVVEPTVAESTPKSEPEPEQPGSVLLASESPVLSPLAPPVLTMSPPVEATPVSGDVLLPMIIFSVVKTNPLHLVSNLLYTQRFRNQSVAGEESYCLINLMAVAEFLENVDLAALGLGDSDKVMSAADLTPIPLNRSPRMPEASLAAADGMPGSLRGRVEQANKVLTDVVDTSFGMLRSLLPHATANNTAAATSVPISRPPLPEDGTANAVKPGFGLLRRESGFSIKSITAALPISRGTKPEEERGQQLMTVSRPGSIKSGRGDDGSVMEEEGNEDEEDEDEDEDEDEEEEDEEDEEEDAYESSVSAFGDTRSIRSFESMLSGKDKAKKKTRNNSSTRRSLSDRLAHMSSLAGLKGSSPTSRRTSLLPHQPAGSSPTWPESLRLAPPIQRFVECTPDDLRLSEVGELLRDYRRLVDGIRIVGGFES